MDTSIRQADAFVASCGVNIHLHYNGTLYETNFPLVKQRLLDAKIRRIRDGLIDTTWSPYYERHNELGLAGIRSLFVSSFNDVPANYADRMFHCFDAYEAPNEPDISGDPHWVIKTRQALCGVRAIQQRGFPLLAPAVTSWNAYNALGKVSPWADYGNLHNYLASRHPGTSGWGAYGYGSLAYHKMLMAQMMGPNAPIITTETGYGDDVMPREVIGAYLVRLLLYQFLEGIQATYLYELVDEGPPPYHQYGLLTADGTPKPAYVAIQQLLTLLEDPGPAFVPDALAIEVRVDGTPPLLSLAFQKRTGEILLALWQETASWEPDQHYVIDVPPIPVKVKIPGRDIATIHSWQPDGTVESVDGSGSEKDKVKVSDRLTLVQAHVA